MKTFSAFFAVMVIAAATVASAAGGYHLLQKVSVPGDEAWDYCFVDTVGRRLYASHNSHVVVMDVDSHALVGKIEKTDGVHGITVARDLGRGFTSNGRSASVTIFNLKTLETIAEVTGTGGDPDSIIYDPPTKRVFTFNKAGKNATAIDAAAGKIVGSIDLGGETQFAASDEKGHVFVDVVDRDVVVKIDSRKLVAEERWPVAPCVGPGTMAIDRKYGRLFIGCGNKLMVVLDTKDGRVIASLPIGQGRDAAAFDTEARLAFSSNGDGTVTVIKEESPEKYSVLENVKTEAGARTMAVDSKTHKIFLPVADRGPAPPPTADNPRPRPPLVPGTFRILIYGM